MTRVAFTVIRRGDQQRVGANEIRTAAAQTPNCFCDAFGIFFVFPLQLVLLPEEASSGRVWKQDVGRGAGLKPHAMKPLQSSFASALCVCMCVSVRGLFKCTVYCCVSDEI